MFIDNPRVDPTDHIGLEHFDRNLGKIASRKVENRPSDKIQVLRHLHLLVHRADRVFAKLFAAR